MATELLDRLQAVFGKLSGPADEADLGHQLSVLADTGRECLDARSITPAFHARFARVPLVVRPAIITDTGQILKPIVNRELVAFVRDVAGKNYNPRAPISDQIEMISDAVATELTRLRVPARQLQQGRFAVQVQRALTPRDRRSFVAVPLAMALTRGRVLTPQRRRCPQPDADSQRPAATPDPSPTWAAATKPRRRGGSPRGTELRATR